MADEKEKPVNGGPAKEKSKAKVAPRKKAAPSTATDSSNAETAQLREELASQRGQFNDLMQGLEKTFGHIHKSSSEQTQKLSSLMIGLEKAFHNIHSTNQTHEKSSANSIEQVSQTIIRSSEELRKEYEEMERLQEQRLAAEKERHDHSFNVLKVIAIPAILLALLGIGYMFYTVTVMERAMTAMSADMSAMRSSMSEMTDSVGGMNSNVQTMSQNMHGMRHDLGVMTHNVAPAMNGMRQMMPWAP